MFAWLIVCLSDCVCMCLCVVCSCVCFACWDASLFCFLVCLPVCACLFVCWRVGLFMSVSSCVLSRAGCWCVWFCVCALVRLSACMYIRVFLKLFLCLPVCVCVFASLLVRMNVCVLFDGVCVCVLCVRV